MNRTLLTLTILGLLTDVRPARSMDWTAFPPLAQARYGAAAASLPGQAYLLGGSAGIALASATVWNDATHTWTEAAPMNQARLYAAATAGGGLVYAIGGSGPGGVPLMNAERYDPVANTWSSIAWLPAPRIGGAAAFVGSAVFLAGGEGEDGSPAAQAYRYDPSTNLWSSIASLPTPRTGVAGAAFDGRMWVIGGSAGGPSATVESYDPSSGAWSSQPSLPEPLARPAAAVADGRLWVVGGFGATLVPSDRVYSAGPDGVWRAETALPAAQGAAAAASLGTCLVVMGGLGADSQPSALAYEGCVTTTPPPPPPPPGDTLWATVRLTPTELNATSQGLWIVAHVTTSDWPITDLDLGSARLDGVSADGASFTSDGASFKFPRGPFASRPDGVYELPFTALSTGGKTVAGTAELSLHGSWLAARKLQGVRGASGHTEVVVSLNQAEDVSLDVLDLQGRVVARLERGTLAAGVHRREWPRGGERVARGSYFVRLRTTQGEEAVKLAVTR